MCRRQERNHGVSAFSLTSTWKAGRTVIRSPGSSCLRKGRSMIQLLLSFVLVVGAIAEQSQNADLKTNDSLHSSKDAQQPKSVKPEDPVITVAGICKDAPVKNDDPTM